MVPARLCRVRLRENQFGWQLTLWPGCYVATRFFTQLCSVRLHENQRGSSGWSGPAPGFSRNGAGPATPRPPARKPAWASRLPWSCPRFFTQLRRPRFPFPVARKPAWASRLVWFCTQFFTQWCRPDYTASDCTKTSVGFPVALVLPPVFHAMAAARLRRVRLRENQFGWRSTSWPGCHVPTLFFTQWCRPGHAAFACTKTSVGFPAGLVLPPVFHAMVPARLRRVRLRENQFGWRSTLWPGCHVPTLFFTQWCRPDYTASDCAKTSVGFPAGLVLPPVFHATAPPPVSFPSCTKTSVGFQAGLVLPPVFRATVPPPVSFPSCTKTSVGRPAGLVLPSVFHAMVLARLGRVCLRENQFGWQLTLWPGCHVPTLFFTQWCRPG
jgi:hypothetical protein